MQYTARGLSTATRLSTKLFIVDSRYVFDIYVLDFSNFFFKYFISFRRNSALFIPYFLLEKYLSP